MLTTQYGNEVVPVQAFFDRSDGSFIGADCRRKADGQVRYYRVDQLRHEDGATGVQQELELAPTKTDQEEINK